MRVALLLVLACVACGAEPAVGLAPVMRLDGLLRDDTRALELYALAGRDKGGVLVTCTSLLNLEAAPGGGAYEVLARASVDFVSGGDNGATLRGVDAEVGVVVFVEALDAASTRIGGGCETVSVKGGATTQVDVTVYDLR